MCQNYVRRVLRLLPKCYRVVNIFRVKGQAQQAHLAGLLGSRVFTVQYEAA